MYVWYRVISKDTRTLCFLFSAKGSGRNQKAIKMLCTTQHLSVFVYSKSVCKSAIQYIITVSLKLKNTMIFTAFQGLRHPAYSHSTLGKHWCENQNESFDRTLRGWVCFQTDHTDVFIDIKVQ